MMIMTLKTASITPQTSDTGVTVVAVSRMKNNTQSGHP